jgi:hypothetical protein
VTISVNTLPLLGISDYPKPLVWAAEDCYDGCTPFVTPVDTLDLILDLVELYHVVALTARQGNIC